MGAIARRALLLGVNIFPDREIVVPGPVKAVPISGNTKPAKIAELRLIAAIRKLDPGLARKIEAALGGKQRGL